MSTQAGTAGWRGDSGAGIHKDFKQTFPHRLAPDGRRSGDDNQPHVRVDMPAFEDCRGLTEIENPTVGAGTDDYLVEIDPTARRDRPSFFG